MQIISKYNYVIGVCNAITMKSVDLATSFFVSCITTNMRIALLQVLKLDKTEQLSFCVMTAFQEAHERGYN